MFKRRTTGGERAGNPGLRLFKTLAWGLLAVLWLFIIFLMGNYWLQEVPATRKMYAAGLEQGFDALAGIIAAADPAWNEVQGIAGRPIGGRLNRLQGDTMFNVWLELDENPSWNSGLATLRFDQEGRLLWARRYYSGSPPALGANPNTGETFSVIPPRRELRNTGTGAQP